ncbi:MAG: nitrite/sulfite reductase [Deltaproteobacteria bacterium]|nr:nitrite/sulfite reductase [Deltaproteobacteria bacterium]
MQAEDKEGQGTVHHPVTVSGESALANGDEDATGKLGSLENPEVYVNLPGQVIPILTREFDDFDNESQKFLRGEKDPITFTGFRLKQGVYGQRQADVQMIRVKLPFGGVVPDQLDALAEVAERYAPLGRGHITTRQNVQFHHILLPDAAQAIRLIGDSGLSSREACGNTVRNVVSDPFAGVCEGEPFDPTPYVGAFVRYFVRNDLTQLLPRKFKVAFTSTEQDVAVTGIHDLGLFPCIKDGQKGFRISTGGGTAILPRISYLLYDFVPLNAYLKVAEAVLRIFNRADELRVNRARARIKFLIDRIGIDTFRQRVDEEMRGAWVNERNFDPEPLKFIDNEEERAPAKPANPGSPNGDQREFSAWVAANVQPQRQPGFSTAEVKVTRGDVSPAQFRGLAHIMRDFTGGNARTTDEQNLLLRWVRQESLYDVWHRLKELGLGDAGARQITDVVSCPGTDSCKLAITNSMGLARAVQERVEQLQIEDPLTKKIHIKMSGCPNGCSRHHLANIGFYGAAMKFDSHQVPGYIVMLGGNYDDGRPRIAERLDVRVPAKRIPDAVERFIRLYQARRNDGEGFNDCIDRVGIDAFEAAIRDLSLPVKFDDEHQSEFIDWNRPGLYKLERGEGECAV